MKALLEVFYQPGKVFESLPERNYAWIVPMVMVGLFGVLAYWATIHYIGADNITRQAMQPFASRIPAEQMEAAIARSREPSQMYIGMAWTFVSVAIWMLVISGLLMAFATMTKAAPRFGTMLAMTEIAWFPYAVVTTLMTLLVLAVSADPTSLDYRNLLATNVGAFLNRNDTSKALYALMTSIDILSFAEIFLLSLGFSKVTKAKFGFSLAVVLALWAVTVLIGIGRNVLFG